MFFIFYYRYCLLVEDGHGIMSEIQMPDDCERSYEEVIEHGEGSSYIFSGLKVLAWITRDRHVYIFSETYFNLTLDIFPK